MSIVASGGSGGGVSGRRVCSTCFFANESIRTITNLEMGVAADLLLNFNSYK